MPPSGGDCPPPPASRSSVAHARLQRWRLGLRSGFFVLFVLAPVLDIFRLDLTRAQFVLFGHHLSLDISSAAARPGGISEAVLNILLRVLLPVVALVVVGIAVSWRWGRLYCGWLCPHFSMVELINGLWRRTNGKPTLWERQALPAVESDGGRFPPRRINALWLWLAIPAFALLWALTLLTYLLPPAEVYGNLLAGTLSHNQTIFLAVASGLFVIDFTFARHLFCRFGCAVGLLQSIAWFANRRALVPGFDRRRVAECAACTQVCDNACPMRLKPRGGKRAIATCTQCGACVAACSRVQRDNPRGPLLVWVAGEAARRVADLEVLGVRGRHPRRKP